MNVIIETERLLLRTFTPDDAELIYQLNLDPEVTRYTHDPVRDRAHAKEILETVILPQYALYNYGRWAVHVKHQVNPVDAGFIGWCGLKMRPERNEIDLGYRFMKKAWGRGFATEAAAACLNHGFKHLGLVRIVGRALPDNEASLRVLKKCGMKFAGEEMVAQEGSFGEGLLHKTYEAFNPFIP